MDQIRKRNQNRGLRKICGCLRRTWAKCPHSWHFNFKPKGGPAVRFSVDTEAGKHIASKTDAEALADGWRTAMRAGTFRRASSAPQLSVAMPGDLTLAAFVSIYFERRRRPERSDERSKLAVLERFAIDRFGTVGAMPLAAITEDVLEQFVVALKRDGFAQSTLNKYITVTKALFAWATKKKYLSVNPAGDSDILARATHAKRTRRLAPDVLDEKGQLREAGEERRLLAEAGPSLQRIIIAGLESGCRRGELLALQWRDVHLQKREVFIRAEEAGAQKTGTARRLPISTRLAGVFEMARAALVVPEGLTGEALAQHVATCYVFGDEAGRKLARIVKAWETCVLKAHGITPAWTNSHALTPECRAALDAIDLHFHDLRHEAGSRLLEAGWPLHHVQHMLGHSNIATTSTYLNAHVVGLAESMKRLDASRCNSVANEAPIEHRPELQRRDPEAAKALVQ